MRLCSTLAALVSIPMFGTVLWAELDQSAHPQEGQCFSGCTPFVIAVSGFFLVLAPYCAIAAHACRLTLFQEGMAVRGLTLRTEFIPWNQIESVTYAARWQSYRVQTWDGKTRLISEELKGIEALFEHLDLYVGRVDEDEAEMAVSQHG